MEVIISAQEVGTVNSVISVLIPVLTRMCYMSEDKRRFLVLTGLTRILLRGFVVWV